MSLGLWYFHKLFLIFTRMGMGHTYFSYVSNEVIVDRSGESKEWKYPGIYYIAHNFKFIIVQR